MSYYGDGSNLTGITASQISGSLGACVKVRTAENTGTIAGDYNDYTNVLNLSLIHI